MRIALAIIAIAGSGASAQVNVLENPGFESGVLAPWFQLRGGGDGEDWNATASDAHSGEFSATDLGNRLVVQEFDAVPVSDILEVSAWVKNPEETLNAFFFQYSDGSEEQWTFSHNSPNWTFFDATSQLDPGKSLVTAGMWGYSGGPPGPDRTFIDDYRVMIEGAGCPADIDGDGDADADDFFAYLDAFAAGDLGVCDIDGDGDCDADDFFGYLDLFAQGC